MTQPADDAQSTFSGTREVDPRYALDEPALDRWLAAHVEGYAGPLKVSQFKGGQSNPTYELVTPGRAYVLRRKPPGTLLPSAHAVDREFMVISALHRQGYAVAQPYALCTDEGVIGSMFYVMDKVEGRVLWDLKLPGMEPAQRRAIYDSQLDALAALHAFDPGAIGLSDYGRPGNYFERQVGRWTKQYRASQTESIAAMDALIEWLPAHVPSGEETSIVHGDYRLDNVIFHPTEPRILAVLDWELSTLGHPLADFAYHCMTWYLPPGAGRGLGGIDLTGSGIPSIKDYVSRYCERTGRADGIANFEFYMAFNMFRMAGILQGIMKRVVDGTAASTQAVAMGKSARSTAEQGWAVAQAIR